MRLTASELTKGQNLYAFSKCEVFVVPLTKKQFFFYLFREVKKKTLLCERNRKKLEMWNCMYALSLTKTINLSIECSAGIKYMVPNLKTCIK